MHLSGGVGIGGVLEPPQAAPVMVGDECLIGSRCMVAEGARVGDGVVLGAGCDPHRDRSRSSTPRAATRSAAAWCRRGPSPSRPPGPRTFPGGEFGLPCVLLIKQLDEGERHDKSKLNDVLRDHGATL